MKVIALISILMAGASANYGHSRYPARLETLSYNLQPSAPAPAYGDSSSSPSYGAQASAPSYGPQVSTYAASSAPSYGPQVSSYGASSAPSYAAAPSYVDGGSSGQAIPITRFQQEIRGSESSSYEFEAANGIKQSENTRITQGNGGSYVDEYGQSVQSNAVVSKSGQYSYTSPEGQQISLSWVADENGFRATGDHLPTAPPMPEQIASSLRGYGGSGYSSSPVRSAGGY